VDLLTHYLQIVLLGIVEGVTEFLPISSTGHLLIAEHWLGTQEPDIFNVVIQAGAILAVVFIYWGKIVDLFANLDKPEERNYLLKIILAFLVTTALVLILTVKLKIKLPEALTPVAWATFIGGLVIFAVEAFAKNLYAHEDVSWFEAVLVGAGQVIAAVFPGASRSGSTIMLGLAAGMKRPSVTQFSFLVGIPTMFAASGYDTLKNKADLQGAGHQLILDTALGFVVSGIVAFFVVKWLLRFVQSHTFNGFAIYRVILGGGLLIGLYTHAIPDVSNEVEKTALVAPAGDKVDMTAKAPVDSTAPAAPALKEAPLPALNSTNPASWTPASLQNPAAPAATETNTAPDTNTAPVTAPSTNAESAPIAPGTAAAN
jgi:undecaprenyl-diphosphatase